MSLKFPTFDHARHVRVGHGDACVVLMIEDPSWRLMDGFAVLTPDVAHALGVRLQQQADASRDVHKGADKGATVAETEASERE